ncbi:hypothetical protein OH809_43360 [Streptomyces sp. NBC_00873]|uniref:hypothetical protein n=1 Tax=unclassified Streptomyces TaxID=2593676 RepID=UPI0038686321|nr:hypothetical protein OH809_00350 [Streptomyces sp. NBC_00873]WSY96864.1 hypothetical protein OH809_43360 [Streptomyces sp. NBC_00873]WTA41363.1 hypothetical protein OH821_00350 [Streptomyces sp. NBC_00842]WTA48534.1 hypothetical protein OH821_43465 [Streptomyces sp. NBC_00842]
MAGAAPEVARAVRAKNYGWKVPLPVAVRDRLGELFPDAEYAQAFGKTGPAGWSPGRLALVTVFQLAESLTDRALADNLIRPGGGGCAGFRGCRQRSLKQGLSRCRRSLRHHDRPCCFDWLTSV